MKYISIVAVIFSLCIAVNSYGEQAVTNSASAQEVRSIYLEMVRKMAMEDKTIAIHFLKSEFGISSEEARSVLKVARQAHEPRSAANIASLNRKCDRSIRVSEGYTRREVYDGIQAQAAALNILFYTMINDSLVQAAGGAVVDMMDAWAAKNIAPKMHTGVADVDALLESEDVDIDKFADDWCDSINSVEGEWN